MARHKYFLLSAFLPLTLAVLFTGLSLAAEEKMKMAVLDFKTVGDSNDLGEGAAEILRTTLLETGQYTVVERSMLNEALKEQKLGLSGTVDQTTAVGIGKLLGAQIVAVGSVVKLGESYTLNVRFVDVHTGEVLSGKKLTAQSREDIPALCNQMVKMLSKREDPPPQPEPAPAQIQKPVKQPAKMSSVYRRSNPGTWAVGGLYPGASLKYVTAGKTAWELRAQSGSGVFAVGPRYYRYFSASGNPRLCFGFEADYITYKGNVSKSSGYAAGAFLGGEIFLTKHIGLLMDFGPMHISLSDGTYSQSASTLEYVMNMGIYWHFR